MDETATLSFGDFELDRRRGELRHGGDPVPVEPRVLDVIAYLAAHPGEVIDRDRLIDAVWGGRIVSDSAIASRINAARTALGDDGTAQKAIRTLPRRGFRFELEVAESARSPLAAAGKPSVAVLPFDNLSGDPEQRYFSDGITDDIITELSRYSELFVAARHSSFAYRDGGAGELAAGLDVQYVAEGSVRRAGDRIRVTARLSAPAAGQVLWSERYDREATDLFDVQDEITAVIVNTLAGQISREVHRRSLNKDAAAVDAYDHFLRAVDLNYRMDPDTVRAAREEAEAAVARDPGLARAHALIAWTHISEASNAWVADPGAALDDARDAAQAALDGDPNDPYGHAVMGWVRMWRDSDFERVLADQERAMALIPGSAYFRSLYAFSLTYAGASERALAMLEDSMRLNPHYPELYHVFCGRSLFNLGRYDEAMPHLDRSRRAMPLHANAIAFAAACYAALGRQDDAEAAVAEIERSSPGYTLEHVRRHVPYADPEEKAHFLAHLATAGLS